MPDTLFFHYKSADKPAGKGVNESLDKDIDKDKYSELNKIKDWRKILSNLSDSPFLYDGYHYRTVEHAFQSQKIKLVDHEKALLFTTEANHSIGNGDGFEARRNRKLIVLNNVQLQLWDSKKHEVMKSILHCKFSQNELPRKVLLSTKDAILTHGTRGIPNSRQYDLENVRSLL